MRLITLFVLLLFGCSIFPKQEALLVEYKRANGDEIGVYYVIMGATTSDAIQVRKKNQNIILWASGNYNCLKHSILVSDSVLQLALTDTGYHNFDNAIDTIRLVLK